VIAAWKLLDGLGSDQVVVGVIDDGFDLGHPDLANKAVSPWDFERNSADVHPEPDPTSPIDGNWHGTACAAVAVGNAGGGHIVGAAPNARLMPVRMNQALSPNLVA
jgi:subtilisin family serine protease